jgi:hypothetical protein
VRLDPGPNPPATALAEVYNVPAPGFGPRGADIDSKGVVWVSLGSGHLGSFDRRKCKGPLNGPNATGDQCPEGWTLYQYPGPGFAGIGNNSAEASYYTWVDQHNTLGLGDDVPISTRKRMPCRARRGAGLANRDRRGLAGHQCLARRSRPGVRRDPRKGARPMRDRLRRVGHL